MSLFESRTVCEQVKFHAIHIDPNVVGEEGNFSIANGKFVDPSGNVINTPNQTFNFNVDSSNNLNLTSQLGAQSVAPLKENFTVAPDGTIDFHGNVLTNIGGPNNDLDVATKQYVLNAIADGSGNPNVMTMEGAWDSSKNYSKADVVIAGSNDYYVSVVDGNTNQNPANDVSGNYWKPFYTPNVSTTIGSGLVATTSGSSFNLNTNFVAGNNIAITRDISSSILKFDVSANGIQAVTAAMGSGLLATLVGSTVNLDSSFVAGSGISITRDASNHNIRFDVSGGGSDAVVTGSTDFSQTNWTSAPSVGGGTLKLAGLQVCWGISPQGNASGVVSWGFPTAFASVPVVFAQIHSSTSATFGDQGYVSLNGPNTTYTVTTTGVSNVLCQQFYPMGTQSSIPLPYVKYLAIGRASA